MIRCLTSLVCRFSGCPSEQRRARLLAMARLVGRPLPSSASDDDVMHAVIAAHRAMEDRAWRAEKRADDAEKMLRDLLSVHLGAQVPSTMKVEPEAIFRELVRARRSGGAQG